jgi:hypothetical protein
VSKAEYKTHIFVQDFVEIITKDRKVATLEFVRRLASNVEADITCQCKQFKESVEDVYI